MFSLYLSENSAWFGNCPLHCDTRVQVVTSVRSADFYHFGLNVFGRCRHCFVSYWRGTAILVWHSRLWQQH